MGGHNGHQHGGGFWTRYVFSQDHKVIAIQYTLTALFVGVVGMGLSWLMRLQLGFPGRFDFIGPSNYYQAMTQHGSRWWCCSRRSSCRAGRPGAGGPSTPRR